MNRHTITAKTGSVVEPFHGVTRSRYRAHAIAKINHDDQWESVVIEVALGESNAERTALRIGRRGFEIPEIVPADERISVRCRGLRPGIPLSIVIELYPAENH